MDVARGLIEKMFNLPMDCTIIGVHEQAVYPGETLPRTIRFEIESPSLPAIDDDSDLPVNIPLFSPRTWDPFDMQYGPKMIKFPNYTGPLDGDTRK